MVRKWFAALVRRLMRGGHMAAAVLSAGLAGASDPPQVMALHGTLKGRVAWELRDPDGTIAQSGEQDNMILDRGLDVFGTATTHGTTSSTAASGYPYFGLWRTYFCLGTGSTEVAATQTNLVSEVLRGTSSGGFGADCISTFSTAGGVVTGQFVLVRTHDFTASYNLAEFGFSDTATAGSPVVIRELFRDGSNNPIVLSVQNGQQLKMTHTFSIALPFANNLSASFTMTGIGQIDGKATFSTVNSYAPLFYTVFNPQGNPNIRAMTAVNSGDPATQGGNMSAVAADQPGRTSIAAYVSGSRYTQRTYVFTTSMANHDHYGWTLEHTTFASATGFGGAFKFSLTNPVKITKTSTNKLTLVFQVSWGRAA